jgi:hypothetical protein
MTKQKNKIRRDTKGKIVTLKFKVPNDFKDPLLAVNTFEEMEVEEFSHYYNIHLGVPMNSNND